MKYDLHVHTSRYSACAVSSPEAMCQAALNRGLQGIALTEHDCWWPLAEVKQLRRQFPLLTILRGVEYSLPEGHFLVFLADPEPADFPTADDLFELLAQVHRRQGLVIWAHPFRYDKSLPAWLSAARLDGMEVASNNMNGSAQALARKVAREQHLPMFHNSDAHHADGLGAYYNDLPVRLKNTRDLVSYFRAWEKRLRPVRRA